MKEMVKRSAIALLAFVLVAGPLAASVNCAEFITSAGDDPPITGWLMGESTVTSTKTYSWSYTNFGGTFNGSSTTTQSYTVGTYQLSNGAVQTLRCDNYQTV
jgi:hypothetical protein